MSSSGSAWGVEDSAFGDADEGVGVCEAEDTSGLGLQLLLLSFGGGI